MIQSSISSISGAEPFSLDSLPPRITDVVETWARQTPDNIAVVEKSESWTYGELWAAVNRTRAWLEDHKIRPGDRVIIVCENSRAALALFLATGALKAWPVPVNAKLAFSEINEIRKHSGARIVLYTTGVSVQARKHAESDGATTCELPELGPIAISAVNLEAVQEPLELSDAENVGALIYTSGTTGRPKGVMLTNRNVLFAAAVSSKIRRVTPEDRVYAILPISHVVGLSVVTIGTLYSGARLYLSPRFDPAVVLRTLKEQEITIMLGAPALFGLLVEYGKLKGYESLSFPSLRIISCSGAPLSPEIRKAAERLLGVELHHGYGITECSPSVAQHRLEFASPGESVGPMVPGVEGIVVNEAGQRLPEGQVGELWIRGPNVMKGYYHAPEETSSCIDKDGWYKSGDLGRFEGGNLYIVGRIKDLIIRFGFNVYPAEVEAVFNSHSAVKRCAVVGKSAGGDEEVIAFVQPEEGKTVDIEELRQYAAQRLASYKQPTRIVVVADMPMTPIGKIIKEQLLSRLA